MVEPEILDYTGEVRGATYYFILGDLGILVAFHPAKTDTGSM